MRRSVEAAVSDWVTGNVFLRMAVSVKRRNGSPASGMHVMRRADAGLRKRLVAIVVPGLPLNSHSNWQNNEGIKLAEIQTAATRIGMSGES